LDVGPDVGTRLVVVGNIGTEIANEVVGAGCSINQLIRDDGAWRTRGAFVRHVIGVVEYLVGISVLTEEEGEILISAAGRSNVGSPRG
jgi:hypothetical protein